MAKKEKKICSVSGKPMSGGTGGLEYKDYLGMNCFEAARFRAQYLFNNFDVVSVNLSGGKDSLVVLELLDMVRLEMKIEKKITVLFYDQELFPDSHVKFLEDIYNTGRFDFNWICVPINSQKYILGKNQRYIQWDVTREFLRIPPPFAETHFEDPPMPEAEVFAKYVLPKFAGLRVVNCTGMRAAESLNRAKAITKASNWQMPWIIESKVKGLMDAKPIYDWGTNDIFKFFFDFGIKYAPVYETQVWSKNDLRVATPFTNEGAKNLNKLRDGDPEFYNRLMQVFPEMRVQANYYHNIDKDAIINSYGATEEGILKYISDELSGRAQQQAYDAVQKLFYHRRNGMKSRNVTKTPRQMQAMYPIRYLFYSVIIGSYKRNIQHLQSDLIEKNLALIDAGEYI